MRVRSVLQYTRLYCREEGCGIVLQDGCGWLRTVLQIGRLLDCIAAWGRNCIAEVQLYCNTVEYSGFKIVLQLREQYG